AVSKGNESASERVAAKRLQHLVAREHRLYRPHSIDANERDHAHCTAVMNMHKNNERGIAIVLALILMSAMSVLAASLMFLSQSETYASMNYRMMSQARYAGEAAVQKASDFLLDGTQYVLPGPLNAIDPLTNYDRTKSPVVCLSGCPNRRAHH